MTETITQERSAGKTVELARYETASCEKRVLAGRRIDGQVRIYDAPLVHGEGTIYPVESGISSLKELAALVADYKRQAERYGDCPMRRTFVDEAIAARREEER